MKIIPVWVCSLVRNVCARIARKAEECEWKRYERMRCTNCDGVGHGLNWQGIPMECYYCNGSGWMTAEQRKRWKHRYD